MTTPYERGIRAEYQAVNDLRDSGYTVIRSAGSHGAADVVAWLGYLVRIIQVKQVRSRLAARCAVQEAITKFDKSGAFFEPDVSFEVWLRYKADWLIIWRSRGGWHANDDYSDILGRTEWPITKKEVRDAKERA